MARDPSKRRVKPTPTVELFPLTLESESEDSDFKLEDDSGSDSGSDSSSNISDESDSGESSSEESNVEQDANLTSALESVAEGNLQVS